MVSEALGRDRHNRSLENRLTRGVWVPPAPDTQVGWTQAQGCLLPVPLPSVLQTRGRWARADAQLLVGVNQWEPSALSSTCVGVRDSVLAPLWGPILHNLIKELSLWPAGVDHISGHLPRIRAALWGTREIHRIHRCESKNPMGHLLGPMCWI